MYIFSFVLFASSYKLLFELTTQAFKPCNDSMPLPVRWQEGREGGIEVAIDGQGCRKLLASSPC